MNPEVKPFSYIKFSQQLEKQISRINAFPLTADNFVIQQDVYKRLGGLADDEEIDEEEAYAVFATIYNV